MGTATGTGYNDLFIAAPLASPAPTIASFNGSYSMAGVDLSSGAQPGYNLSYLMQLNPDGAGNLGSPTVSAYEGGDGSQVINQTLGTTTLHFQQWGGGGDFPDIADGGAVGAGVPVFFGGWQLRVRGLAGSVGHDGGSAHGHRHAELSAGCITRRGWTRTIRRWRPAGTGCWTPTTGR